MRESLRLGRIAGTPIGMNWSLIVIAWLLTWSLATVSLPDAAKGYSSAGYWIAGAVTSVAFLASILFHELGHALVARRHGITVEGINLWLFGGVSKLESLGNSARSELRIAIAGPSISILIGGFGLAAAFLLHQAGGSSLAVAALSWIGSINLTLAVFNLIPASPLDGGRVLTAFLWSRSGSETDARTKSAMAGIFFGQLLIGVGLVIFAFGGNIGGLWFVFLGWFLLSAARAEQQDAIVHGTLDRVLVRSVMTPDPEVAPTGLSVQAFVDEVVERSRHSAFPLEDPNGRIVGLVTLRRLREVRPLDRPTTPVDAIATPTDQVVTCAPDDRLVDLIPRLGRGDGRVLVMEAGRLVGIVSPSDIARSMDRESLRQPT